MKDYIHRIMRYKTITRISKEWYNMRLISKSEYRKVCRIIKRFPYRCVQYFPDD